MRKKHLLGVLLCLFFTLNAAAQAYINPLKRFATHNLDGVNQFSTSNPQGVTSGKLYQFGRNVPLPNSGNVEKSSKQPTILTPVVWGTTFIQTAHATDNDWFFLNAHPLSETSDWHLAVQKTAEAIEDGATKAAYQGSNISLEGDPCPEGYHLPHNAEWTSILPTVTLSSDDRKYNVVETVYYPDGVYNTSTTADYYMKSPGLIYAVKMKGTNFATAFRYEKMDTYWKITARAAGSATITQVSNWTDQWNAPNVAVREFSLHHAREKFTAEVISSGTLTGRYWSKRRTSDVASRVHVASFGETTPNTLRNAARGEALPLRCIRNAGGTPPEEDEVLVSSVTLDNTTLTLEEGQSVTLTATVLPDNATNKSLNWTSSNPAVATVNQSGEVTALTTGTTIVKATAKDGSGKYDECTVTVEENVPPVIPVTSVTLNKNEKTLVEGGSEMLTATVLPHNATDKSLTWTSSNPTAATVNQAGEVTALTIGTTTIRATAKDGSDKYDECVVTVVEPILVTGVTLDQTELTLKEGDIVLLTATVLPDNATDPSLNWTSSNPAVASVNAAGMISALEMGTTTIRATANDGSGHYAECTLTVEEYIPPVIPVTSVTLDKTTLTLEEGQSASLNATVMPADASDKSLTWSSSNPAVATVNDAGVVTALTAGTTIVKATANDDSGKYGECTVTVQEGVPPQVPVTAVTLNKTTLTLLEGASASLIATVTPDNATDKSLTWSSSNPAVASVNQAGVVTALTAGTTTVKATANDASGKYAECVVTVKEEVIPVTSVTLDKTTLTLEEEQTATLVATVAPDNATDPSLTWSSSNPAIASVNDEGVVTALTAGTTTIRATANDDSGKYGECTVTVTPKPVPVTSVTLDKTTLTLEEEQTATLVATVLPDNATDKSLTWTSSDPTVATVDDQGVVTALTAGTTTIRATANDDSGKYAECAVTVTPKPVPVTSVTLNKHEMTLVEGQSESLIATVLPDDATDPSLTWSSSNPAIATVNDAGVVTAVKAGTAVVKATAKDDSGKYDECTVTVNPKIILVTSVTLDNTTLTLEEGQSTMLKATVAPDDATDKSLTWTSSDPAVATVNQVGVVTALKAGTTTIKATAKDESGKYGECTVTVKKKVIPVTSVSLDKSTLSLEEGTSAPLTARVRPSNATDPSLTWSSSDPDVATVDDEGVVTALTVGTTTVKAAANDGSGKYAECAVTVTPKVIPVTSVTLDNTTLTLEEGASASLVATVAPGNATNPSLAWSSSNPSVASVSDQGVVTAYKEGTTTVKAAAKDGSGKYAECAVTVNKKVIPVTSVTLNNTTLTLEEGQSATLTATVAPDDATDPSLTWSSSDPAVATVTNTGVVTAVKAGTATVKAAANDGSGKYAECAVTVKKPKPDKPAGLKAAQTYQREVVLKWTRVEGQTYRVRYGDKTIEVANADSVMVGKLLPGTAYTFTLVTVKDDLESEPVTIEVTTVKLSEGNFLIPHLYIGRETLRENEEITLHIKDAESPVKTISVNNEAKAIGDKLKVSGKLSIDLELENGEKWTLNYEVKKN
ncbi:MAG: Ig-like domain-containing protein [Bacteroidota bacterium]|nr:Ig-like domain-containing protein [Bacteroidota bacterium]